MAIEEQSNSRSPSTTSEWEWAKIRRRRNGPSSAARRSRTSWNRRDPLTLTVRELGGSECWLEIKARGHTWRIPGHRYLIDALEEIWDSSS